MNLFKSVILSSTLIIFSAIWGGEFTVSSYNCGGLSDHYDYLRAASMQKVMQERYTAEPEQMALNDKIQKTALRILFSKDGADKAAAQQEWDQKEYGNAITLLTLAPDQTNSPNALWNERINDTITSYQVRPIIIFDDEVNQMIAAHLKDLVKSEGSKLFSNLEEARAIMAERIFAHHLKYDIICLQEADYLDAAMFPEGYEVLLSESRHSKNGIAWNTERFEFIENLGDIMGRGCAVKLKEMEMDKIIVAASGHLTGCNPYRIDINPVTGLNDAAKGDNELREIMEWINDNGADLMVIGMDSNVTSLHPRLNILKEADYQIDCENYLEPTCSNPHLGLDTRLDWIAIKSDKTVNVSIANIPVLGVGLNNLQTNISDHKPIAAKIIFQSSEEVMSK